MVHFIPHHPKVASLIFLIFFSFLGRGKESSFSYYSCHHCYLITIHYQNIESTYPTGNSLLLLTYLLSIYTLSNAKENLRQIPIKNKRTKQNKKKPWMTWDLNSQVSKIIQPNHARRTISLGIWFLWDSSQQEFPQGKEEIQ